MSDIIKDDSGVNYTRNDVNFGHSPVAFLDDASYNNVMKLNDKDKLILIKVLTESVTASNKEENTKSKAQMLEELCGSWQDNRTTAEIIADIRAARTSNKEIEL